MITLYLVRHGESTYNAEGRVQGHEDPPLSVLGIRQADAIADRLESVRIDRVYSSDLIRASRTAEVVAQRRGLQVSTTPLLREANLGVVQGLTRAEIEEKFPDVRHQWRANAITARPPGAESIEQVISRCAGLLDGLLSQTEDGLGVLMVGHGGSLRGIVVSVLGLPPEAYHKLRFSNASLSIVDLADRRELRLLNDVCHLDSLRGSDDDTDSVP